MHKYNMSNQELHCIPEDNKMTLSKLLNIKDNPETVEEEVIKSMLYKSSVKIQEEIIHGNVDVFDPNNIIEQIERRRQRREKLQSQLQKLNIHRQQKRVKELKRQIIKLKMEQAELVKKEAKIKTKNVVEKVKKWQELQEQIRMKKEKQQQERQRQLNEQMLRKKKEQARQEKERRQEKKRQIAQKLKKIEEQRLKREQIIKFSQNQYAKLNPKYLQIQKKFKQLQEQITFQKDISKKNHKINMKIDHAAIKNHQKNYITDLKQRISKHKQLKTVSDHDFSLFLLRNQQKIAEQKQKFKRRMEFQNKLKEVHIDIDNQKKMKIDIARDKGKNPLKYHFLSQKALDDQQIYGQFQDFQIKANPKELGKEYLKELPSLTQNSRITKSRSVHTLNERQTSQRSKYKDYLQDLKSQRVIQAQPSQQQLVSSLYRSNSENKSKIIQRLDQRSKKYELQVQKRKQQMQGYNNLQSSIKKAKQIDQVYVKSLKAKLACIEMKE